MSVEVGQQPPPGLIVPPEFWRHTIGRKGLYIYVLNDESADIRVYPAPDPLDRTKLTQLSDVKAGPLTKLAFEAYTLKTQLRGLKALAQSMKQNGAAVKPEQPDVNPDGKGWHAHLDVVNVLLGVLEEPVSELHNELNQLCRTEGGSSNDSDASQDDLSGSSAKVQAGLNDLGVKAQVSDVV